MANSKAQSFYFLKKNVLLLGAGKYVWVFENMSIVSLKNKEVAARSNFDH